MWCVVQMEQDSYELHCEDLHPTNKFVGPDSPYMKPADASEKHNMASPRTRAAGGTAQAQPANVIGLPSQMDFGDRKREMKEERNKEYNEFLVRLRKERTCIHITGLYLRVFKATYWVYRGSRTSDVMVCARRIRS